MNDALKFLIANRTFYIATIENNQPRVRPFGFVMEYEGRIYFSTGNTKDVFRQLKKNPNFEVCSTPTDYEWVRIKGKAVFDNNLTAKAKAFEVAPFLADIYKTSDNPNFEVFYIEDGEATIYSMKGEKRIIKL